MHRVYSGAGLAIAAVVLLGTGGSERAVGSGAASAAVTRQDPTRIDWQTDRKKAFDDARRSGKPIWVLFR